MYALKREYLVKRKGRVSSLRVLMVFGPWEDSEKEGKQQIISGTAFGSPFNYGYQGTYAGHEQGTSEWDIIIVTRR